VETTRRETSFISVPRGSWLAVRSVLRDPPLLAMLARNFLDTALIH
jgi:hypothetical protein